MYPILQQLNYTHNNIGTTYDCYFDGSWRSSYLGSNFMIYKASDQLMFNYASNYAPGTINYVNVRVAMSISNLGDVTVMNTLNSNILNSNSFNNTGNAIISGKLQIAGTTNISAGTVTAPSIFFSGDTTTGIFKNGALTLSIASNSTEVARFNNTQDRKSVV